MVINHEWLGLEGKRVLVTGAGSGIGKGAALGFASAGAKVAVLDVHSDAVEAVARECRSTGGQSASAFVADVTDEADIRAAVSWIESEWGGIDVVANIAGILEPGRLDEISVSDWERTLRINLAGVLLVSQIAKESMHGSGAFVHAASISGSHPQAYSGSYSSGKAALKMLSRQMAFEWGPSGIRSNVVSPNQIRTPINEHFFEVEGVLEAREAVTPLRRIGHPDDVTSAVLFLASERSSYITGQDITIDGGYSQTLMAHLPRPGYDEEQSPSGLPVTAQTSTA